MFNTILVALDGSPQSAAVIELSRKVTAGHPAAIHILCVVDGAYLLPEENYFYLEEQHATEASDGLIYPPADREYQAAQETVNQAVDSLRWENRRVSGLIIGGEPTQVIIQQAARLKVDLIVMGHRHLSSLKRWVEHSIVKEVIDLAACPVLVENEETEQAC